MLDPFRLKKPPSFDTTAAAILAEASTLPRSTTDLYHRIVASITPDNATFENTVRPLAEDENVRSGRENHLRFYASTHPAKEVREASHSAADIFQAAEVEVFSQRKLFALVNHIVEQVRATSSATFGEMS